MELEGYLHMLIGSDADTISIRQMVVRGTLIFFYALLLIRLGGRRVFGKNTTFDIVLGIILGSILGRALTANAPFVPTLVTSGALVILHKILANLAFRFSWIGHIIKGSEIRLVEDGRFRWDEMKKTNITQNDLLEAIRSSGYRDVSEIRAAYLERSGDISIIK